AASLPFASLSLDPPLAGLAAAASLIVVLGIHAWPAWRRRGSTRTGVRPADGAPGQVPSVPPATGARRATVGSRIHRRAAMALAGAVLVAGAVIVSRPAGAVRVTVLDVGQGDAILVEGSRGGRLLIDGGPDPARLMVVLDGRIPPWDRRLDAVILSHPHED